MRKRRLQAPQYARRRAARAGSGAARAMPPGRAGGLRQDARGRSASPVRQCRRVSDSAAAAADRQAALIRPQAHACRRRARAPKRSR